MKQAKNFWLFGAISLLYACTDSKTEPPPAAPAAANAVAAHYSMEDFARVRKLDAHVHANVAEPAFLEQARADGFELMSINVDYPDFPKLADAARRGDGAGEGGSATLPLGHHVLDERVSAAPAGPRR